MNRTISLEGLKAGLHPTISGTEFATLRGCSASTIEKERTRGAGVPFLKDPRTGRINYRAEDILEFFERGQRCQSTAEYDTSSHCKRLERARNVLQKRNKRRN